MKEISFNFGIPGSNKEETVSSIVFDSNPIEPQGELDSVTVYLFGDKDDRQKCTGIDIIYNIYDGGKQREKVVHGVSELDRTILDILIKEYEGNMPREVYTRLLKLNKNVGKQIEHVIEEAEVSEVLDNE